MMTRNLPLLAAAHRAYCADADLRRRRTRYKHFTYGRQWGDPVTDSDGSVMTEGELASKNGRVPLTNNLIRQLVKTIVGRFRASLAEAGARPSATALRNQLDELDSRMLEEFLISGCAIQRLSHECRHGVTGWWVDNVNPARFFVDRREDPRATDIELAGMLHDMSMPELLARFSGGDRAKAARLRQLYGTAAVSASPVPATTVENEDFFTAPDGRCRVVEIWTLDSREVLRCHDPLSGEYYLAPTRQTTRIAAINRRRRRTGEPAIVTRWEIDTRWQCRYMAPDGTVIAESPSAMTDGGHPFVMKFYPLTDGEIHPFVEDVIDQQKYVNRLITLIDNVMGTSAKGVLLFPEDQLSDGTSWADIKAMWASYDGVIPYRPRPGHPEPHQVVTNAANTGAYELLALEMKLFEEVSGVSGAIRGRESTSGLTSAQLYDAQARNAAIALTDIFDSFESFRRQRTARLPTAGDRSI